MLAPHPPNRGTKTARREVAPIFQDPESQAVNKATPYIIPKENWRTVGELQKASVCGVFEFKPRRRGSWGQGPKPAEACCPTVSGSGSRPSIVFLPFCSGREGRCWLGTCPNDPLEMWLELEHTHTHTQTLQLEWPFVVSRSHPFVRHRNQKRTPDTRTRTIRCFNPLRRAIWPPGECRR